MPSDLLSVTALICERVLNDQDDLLTAVRIADVIFIPPEGTASVNFYALILVKVETAERHTRKLSTDVVYPSGERLTLGKDHTVEFSARSDNHPSGGRMIINLRLRAREMGTHWLEVSIDGERLSRLPFTLRPLPKDE